MDRRKTPTIHVIDFFSGCGGTAAGFRDAGFRIRLGLDNDADAAATYKYNFPDAAFIQKDIRKVKTSDLRPYAQRPAGDFLLFSICAPCAPFSKQRREVRRKDPRATLLWASLRFVRAYRPDFIFIENVPGIQSARSENGTLADFRDTLTDLGYDVEMRRVSACDYGVPQRRRRFILLASRHEGLQFPAPTHGPDTSRPYVTVWDAIGRYPRIAAGTQHAKVPNHRAAALSEINQERMRHTPRGGGSRSAWPRGLRLRCHTRYSGHSDVYGRLRKRELSSGLTTRCISLSNGRFGHPTQNRAISVREAAALQTFPDDFIFLGTLNAMARQVGNAVPVALAKRFGMEFKRIVRAKTRRRRNR